MPVYEYECAEHGAFEALQPMSAYQRPHPCPQCGEDAPRVLLTAPAVSAMSSSARSAHARNERSRHAPITADIYREKHGPGCSCCSARKPHSATASNSATKCFPKQRPWMISH